MTMATSTVLITLTDRDREELGELACARNAPLRGVQRAWIVLAAADGQRNAEIGRSVGMHVDTVRTFRGRFATGGLASLADRHRSGRRRSTPPCRPRSRRWPAPYPPSTIYRCRASRAPTWSP